MSAAPTALLLAGQGSERSGMTGPVGCCPDCREILAVADRVLDLPLSRWMAEGPTATLRRTDVAQPALLAVGVAQGEHLRASGVEPVALAGHSLGQYTALVLAGSLTFEDALLLVAERGRLMRETVPAGRGSMAAVAGLETAEVLQACERGAGTGTVGVACFNAPGRIVLSGAAPAVEAAVDACWEAGGGSTAMEVEAPFHSELLAPMVPRFARAVAGVRIADPRVPVIDNVTARPLMDAGSVRRSLVEQIVAPVLFEESLRTLVELGAERFVGIGPGRAALKFASLTVPCVPRSAFEDLAASSGDGGGAHGGPVR